MEFMEDSVRVQYQEREFVSNTDLIFQNDKICTKYFYHFGFFMLSSFLYLTNQVANGPQLSGQNAQNRVGEEDEQVFEGKLVERAVQERDDTEDGVIENDAANGEN